MKPFRNYPDDRETLMALARTIQTSSDVEETEKAADNLSDMVLAILSDEFDAALDAADLMKIDEAWGTFKAAGPSARVINDNQPGNTAVIEILCDPPTLEVGTELFSRVSPTKLAVTSEWLKNKIDEDAGHSVEAGAPIQTAEDVARQIWLYFRGRDETPVEAGAWFDNNKSLGGPARIIELVRSVVERQDAEFSQLYAICKYLQDERLSLEAAKGEIKEALTKYEESMALIGGCGDVNCLIEKPHGQHTNGGCNCYQDRRKASKAMARAYFLAHEIRKVVA